MKTRLQKQAWCICCPLPLMGNLQIILLYIEKNTRKQAVGKTNQGIKSKIYIMIKGKWHVTFGMKKLRFIIRPKVYNKEPANTSESINSERYK